MVFDADLLRSLNDGNLTRTQLLLDEGADPNHVLEGEGVAGVAPMHMAAGIGTEALRLLLQFGGDPNVRSVEGVTPLHIAATWGELDSVKLLLFNGGDPSVRDQEGLRPVDVAKQYNHEDVVCFLKYHALLLVPDEDDKPRYTRESIESSGHSLSGNASSDVLNVSFVDDSSPDESLATCARRSDLYTNTLQQKLIGCMRAGRSVCMDVTSPRHPCIEFRTPPRNTLYRGRNSSPCQYPPNSHMSKHGACRDLFSCRRDVHDCRCNQGNGSCGYHEPVFSNCGDHESVKRSWRSCEAGWRSCSRTHISYTDTDPDCWEGSSGDTIRNGLRDFHKSYHHNGRNHNGCCQGSSESCSHPSFSRQRYNDNDSHCNDHSQDSDHDDHKRMSRSYNNENHGYDRDDDSYPCTVKKMPKKSVSDPSPVKTPWTKLRDHQETSAEKVSRWQTSLHPSPNRFFPPLPGHLYESPQSADDKTPEAPSRSKPRRSSMYTSNIQRQLEQHLEEGSNVCFDVTSPGHPYIDFKPVAEVCSEKSPVKKVEEVKCGNSTKYNGKSPTKKHDARYENKEKFEKNSKRLSTVSSISSCDTFVTCDDDTEFTMVTPIDPAVPSCVYSSDGSENIILNVKSCVEDYDISKLDVQCRVSGYGEPNTEVKFKISENGRKRQSNPIHMRERSPSKYDRHPSIPSVDHELDLSDMRKAMAASNNTIDVKNKVQTDIRSFTPEKNKWKHPLQTADLNLSDLMSSDSSFIERTKQQKAEITPKTCFRRNRMTSQDKQKWLPPSQRFLDDTDLWTSDESFQIRERDKRKTKDGIKSLVKKLDKVSVNPRKPSPTRGKKRVSLDSYTSSSSVKEFLYKDREKGITLLERYVPSDCDESSTRESIESSCSTLSFNSEDTELYDWQDYQSDTDDSRRQTTQRITRSETNKVKKTSVPHHLSQLSNHEIRDKLKSLGDEPGPITMTTRQTYLVRLATIEADPACRNQMKLTVNGPEYSPELCAALQGNLDLDGMDEFESKMAASFQDSQGRCWREGTQKSSFNYLLLDPRVTRNLPIRAKNLSPSETFKAFIHAIFYIGKGKRARPYCHLYEAISQMQKPKPKVSTKVQHILDIWGESAGVVSLHIFQSVIPVEAYTREACMVDAVGLNKLTNMKKGDYYGVASTWPMKTKRQVGVHLLKKALQIFLSEGERQISPVDIKKM